MQFGLPMITMTMVFAAALGVSVLGALVWWLVRKRQNRVWLPTVRILQIESNQLPRLVVTVPPLLAFLCFLVAAFAVTLFALKPRQIVFTEQEPSQTRLHIFVDLSPSMAAQSSIFDLKAKVANTWQTLSQSGRVSLSTSHSDQIYEPKSSAEVEQLIQSLDFHRAGLRIGSSLKPQLEKIGAINRLFIVSDRDQHSWSGFNWSYLSGELDVMFVEVESSQVSGRRPTNFLINSAQFLSTPASHSMDWDVEIVRRGAPTPSEGLLKVSYRGTVLATMPWKMAAEKSRQILRASWPSMQVVAPQGIDTGVQEGDPLIWQIEVAGGDAIAADNEYRAPLLGLKQDVVLVSEPAGEQALEDPVHQLQVVLEVLGFKIRRLDSVTQQGPKPAGFPLWILVGGTGKGVDMFCPKSLVDARLSGQWATVTRGVREAPKVWLAPYNLNADYAELCHCYHRLLQASSAASEAPLFCRDLNSRTQWTGLLPSLGAKQVGGELGEASGSLAWTQRHAASGLEVMAFTVPLRPSIATGISHAAMPMLVRQLLGWQGLLSNWSVQAGQSWPRIADIAEIQATPKETSEVKMMSTVQQIKWSNVPLAESLLSPLPSNAMPPKWSAQTELRDGHLSTRRQREEALPWIHLLIAVAGTVTVFEALWGSAARLRRRLQRTASGAVLLALSCFWNSGEKAHGQVQIDTVKFDMPQLTFNELNREVSQRTSIEVSPRPIHFDGMDDPALEQPWLWIHDVRTVASSSGEMQPELVLWLKRGGFLIIEGVSSPEVLVKLTTKAFSRESGKFGWQPIPPDHELMRSFYLLDALPSCQATVWQGFHFDARLAILAVPYRFLATLQDSKQPVPGCASVPERERSIRVFVNLLMVALATDYKKDQIHLPEILKRLR